MELSVIIVNWNTKELLINCLSSLYSDKYNGEYEVWVVDNASKDGSVEAVRQQFPTVKLISSSLNIGFGAANNLAILQSKGDYIWLLNSDALVRSGTISPLVKFLDENPSAGGVGSKLLNPDGSLQTSCYPFPSITRETWRLFHLDAIWTYGVYDQLQWDPNEPREVDIIQGASLVLRREALENVGVFDEDYFMYSEEVDLCYRLKNAGWHLYWIPRSEVVHFGGQSTQQVAAEMFLALYQSKLLFFRKHRSRFETQLYKLTISFASLIRLLLSPLAWFEDPFTREKHLTLANNYRQLLKELWTSNHY
jgi:GT2 family glycosyltransferase